MPLWAGANDAVAYTVFKRHPRWTPLSLVPHLAMPTGGLITALDREAGDGSWGLWQLCACAARSVVRHRRTAVGNRRQVWGRGHQQGTLSARAELGRPRRAAALTVSSLAARRTATPRPAHGFPAGDRAVVSPLATLARLDDPRGRRPRRVRMGSCRPRRGVNASRRVVAVWRAPVWRCVGPTVEREREPRSMRRRNRDLSVIVHSFVNAKSKNTTPGPQTVESREF